MTPHRPPQPARTEADAREQHTAPYNLYQPPHFITSDVLRRIEDLLEENGVRVTLGGRIHEAVETLVNQYRDMLIDTTPQQPADAGEEGGVMDARLRLDTMED